MSKNLWIGLGVGIACVVAAVAGILYVQRGAHLDLPGQVLKARMAPIDDNNAVAMLDFRISNTSDYPAVVRTVKVYVEDQKGNRAEGLAMSDPDAKRLFHDMPLLGVKYNPSLIVKDQIPAHATWDRMIGGTFALSESKIQARRTFVVSIEEIDGKVFEIREK